jgi:biotin carboxylase
MVYFAQVDEVGSLQDTAEAVRKAAKTKSLAACFAGGEAGVDLADALSEHLGLRTNGTGIPNRRDKKVQQELIHDLGMRSVRQAGSDKFEDMEEFLKTEEYPVVLKPTESAGSDGVKLCNNFEEAKEHFQLLMDSQMVNGGDCAAVLCQEFLRGKEYVVDLTGQPHKTMIVGLANALQRIGTVYFGCVSFGVARSQDIIPYVRGVLDALGFNNGQM